MAKTNMHQYLVETLRKEIHAQCKPGDRLPSDRALAERFGVSNVTIRNAMTTLVQESLVERHVGRGTHVLDSKKNQHVGLLIASSVFDPQASTFGLTTIRHAIGMLNDRHIAYRIYLMQEQLPDGQEPGEDENPRRGGPSYPPVGVDFMQAITANKLLGLLVISATANPEWVQPLKKRGVPLVGALCYEGFEYRVRTDPTAVIHRAVQYLMGHGRRKLAYIGWGPRATRGGAVMTDHRLASFKAACERGGITPFAGWIDSHVNPDHPGSGWEAFRVIWSANRNARPDGLLVTDDRVFRDVSIAISNMGLRIPEQLMVVTHANRYSGMVAPFPVARMEIDPTDIAEKACNMLLELMADHKPEKKVIVTEPAWRDEIFLTPDVLRGEGAIAMK